jgi:hypothetical protein
MMNREILSFITSGRMSSLRELAVSIDYKDWVGRRLESYRESITNMTTAPLPPTPAIHSPHPLSLHPLHRRPRARQQH